MLNTAACRIRMAIVVTDRATAITATIEFVIPPLRLVPTITFESIKLQVNSCLLGPGRL